MERTKDQQGNLIVASKNWVTVSNLTPGGSGTWVPPDLCEDPPRYGSASSAHLLSSDLVLRVARCLRNRHCHRNRNEVRARLLVSLDTAPIHQPNLG